MEYTALDFFCGMGGASLGIKRAGFKVLKGYDNWQDALDTHHYNLPDIEVVNVDITTLDTEDIPNVDYMHFSPPCQPFSTSGKKLGIEDLRGQLIYEPIRIVRDKKPKAFSIENVKGLTTGKNKQVLDEMIKEFIRIGYKAYWKVLNAYDYEVVQNRERLFIIGIRSDIDKEYEFPKPIPNNRTLRDVIGCIEDNKGIPKHGENLIEKLKYIPQGGNVMDIPEEIRPRAFKNSYSRLRWDQIPPTITRNYKTPSSANCIHPCEHRGLSDTEALLIQSFDEDWVMCGKQRNLQIGNVVPPKMMEHMAKSILETIR